MTDLRKAAEQALEILDMCFYDEEDEVYCLGGWHQEKFMDAREALRQALAQPEQRGHCVCGHPEALEVVHFRTRPCFHYIHRPKREWFGLTDDERKQIVSYIRDPIDWVPAVEAKLKEKNV